MVGDARRHGLERELPGELWKHGEGVEEVFFDHLAPIGDRGEVHFLVPLEELTTEGDQAYEDLDLDIGDMDVIFAYPWPDEEFVTTELFEHYAGAGALLVTYHGGDDFRIRRKTPKRRR